LPNPQPKNSMSIYLKRFFILFCYLIAVNLYGQLPLQNAKLNHSTVYFEEQFVKNAKQYQLILYSDSLNTTIVKQVQNQIPAFLIDDLNWGSTYYWYVNALDEKGTSINKSSVNQFRIQKKINAMYVKDTRLDIKTNNYADSAGGYILLDHSHAIYDRKGKQVWALPETGRLFDERKLIRDFNVSPYNSITVLAGPVPVELDFEGRVLWKAPYPMILGNDTLVYHHDFKRHPNGHYFVLANRKVSRQVLGNYADSLTRDESGITKINDTLYKRTLHGLLLEFDEAGKLIWYWDSFNYISTIDLNYKKGKNGFPTFGTHMNAFSVNSNNTKAYIGFRDLNRIVKIDKKSKEVEMSYGEKYPSGEAQIGHKLFRGQHDATITKRKTILIFNNNNSPQQGDGISSVLEIKENAKNEKDILIWKFDLNFDSLTNGKGMTAGNVQELPNGNLLVCGGVMPRIFEVTRSKKIVWDALPYYKSSNDSAYTAFAQYRSHWSPQLYYYHFMVKTDSLVSNNGEVKTLNIQLFNTGNTSDAYQIEIVTDNNQVVYSKKTNLLKANAQSQMKIKLNKAKKNNSLQLRITSINNKLLNKTLVVN